MPTQRYSTSDFSLPYTKQQELAFFREYFVVVIVVVVLTVAVSVVVVVVVMLTVTASVVVTHATRTPQVTL